MTARSVGFQVVGKSVPRVNAADKVRGKAVFTDDIALPGMVYGKIKHSTVAHAKIKRIDADQALCMPGVLAVITGEECPKPFSVNNYKPTELPLASDKVVYYGEGVAAVAAVDEKTAERALDRIEVEYEELPVLLDPREAMAQDQVRIHEWAAHNLNYEGKQHFGDVDRSLEESHAVVANSFFSSYTHCGFLEPQSTVADYNAGTGRLTVHTCNQLPHYLQQTISRTLDIPMERIRVIVPTVGGAFGGKTEATPACMVACLLSRKLGRPVKITYSRQESFFQNKGRHPCLMKMKMGFDPEGRITAVDFDCLMDGGAHSSWGFVVLWFIAALTHLPYKIPNVRYQGKRIFTNKPTPGAQRCLGGVQVRICVEGLLDMGAEKLGISPYRIRRLNAVETGYRTATVIEVRHSEFQKCLESVARRSRFEEKQGKLPFGRGIGMAGGHYSTGGAFLLYRSYRPHSTAHIRVDTEAGVTLYIGATGIGQGSSTVMCQMTAEVLGIDYRDVHLVCQDTLLAPMDNGTFDSRLTYGAGHAIKQAALDVRGKLFAAAATMLGVNRDHLECAGGEIFSIYDPQRRIPFKKAVYQHLSSVGPLTGDGNYTPPQPRGDYEGRLIGPSPAFGFTAQAVEVEIDTDTGKIQIVGYWEAGDCGAPINPSAVEGQVQGAISMGLGAALFEEMVVDGSGQMLNPNFHDYRMPTALDMPDLDLEIVDSYDPTSAFGNKEVGEGPVGPVIPAILNAVYDAIGIRFTEVPLKPEKILRALGKIAGPDDAPLYVAPGSTLCGRKGCVIDGGTGAKTP
ncbi:MAG: carbon monoxide dehydrogenase [Acidobacteria bacterium]|nr:carbon monoxide dehydrogenase [Acidobacteriota bacterium]